MSSAEVPWNEPRKLKLAISNKEVGWTFTDASKIVMDIKLDKVSVLLDYADYSLFQQHPWRLADGYISSTINKKYQCKLSRYILGCLDKIGGIVHKNKNRLDHRRENLYFREKSTDVKNLSYDEKRNRFTVRYFDKKLKKWKQKEFGCGEGTRFTKETAKEEAIKFKTAVENGEEYVPKQPPEVNSINWNERRPLSYRRLGGVAKNFWQFRSHEKKEMLIEVKEGVDAIADFSDYDLIKHVSWFLSDKGYVYGWLEGKYLKMHKYILGLNEKAKEPDHLNRNKRDNRRKNLSIVTRRLNVMNRGLLKNNTTGFAGITKRGMCWVVTYSPSEYNRKSKQFSFGERSLDDEAQALDKAINFRDKMYALYGNKNNTDVFPSSDEENDVEIDDEVKSEQDDDEEDKADDLNNINAMDEDGFVVEEEQEETEHKIIHNPPLSNDERKARREAHLQRFQSKFSSRFLEDRFLPH